MRTLLLGLIAASSVFALSTAGATGYTLTLTQTGGSIAVPGAKTVTIDEQSKCTDALNIAYTATNGVITRVTVTDSAALPSADCVGLSNSTLTMHDSASLTTGAISGTRYNNSSTHLLKWEFDVVPSFDLGAATGPVNSDLSLMAS